MNTEQAKKVERSIERMKNKESRLYFLVQDTKGNAKASVRYIYQMAMTLKQNGYNPIILHETKEYFGVNTWLGDDYMNELPHKPIDGGNLEISPDDILFIPEIFGYVMEQVKNLPCGKVVISQAYDHILETLQPGQNWAQLGILKCITTSEKQKEFLSTVMRKTTFEVINPVISEVFEKPVLPPKTIVGIHTRDQRDTANIIKQFYLQYPQYRWITFRDLRGLSESEFSNAMKDTFVSVWVDQTSSFGTFPLESMKMGIPVIGLVPNIQPDWLNEDNGLWLINKTSIVGVIADYIQNWLEDNINPELYDFMEKTSSEYSSKENFDTNVLSTIGGMIETRMRTFEEQLNKFEIIE